MQKTVIGAKERQLICVPLVAKNSAGLWDELDAVLLKKPDIIEWRADNFDELNNFSSVVTMANRIHERAKGLSVIFTIRSRQEGGNSRLTDQEIIALNAEICQHTPVEYIDCETRHRVSDIKYLGEIAQKNQVKLIGSFHNFAVTPSKEALIGKFIQAAELEMDVAKVAVMPENLEDILTLLCATLEAGKIVPIPLISISMGKLGTLTRMFGHLFGSSLAYAVGQNASAPGQLSIEELKAVTNILENAMND